MVVNGGPNGVEIKSFPRKSMVRPDGPMSLDIERVTATDGANVPLVDDHVFLIGRPSLRGFVSFVTDLAVDGATADRGVLAAQWRAGHAEVQARDQSESGIADGPEIRPVPAHLQPLVDKIANDPLYQHAFDVVPTEVGIVELDSMVVYQKHINLAFVRQLRERLGERPNDEQIFRTCLPFDHPAPPVKWMRTHGNTYIFLSPSNDIRYLGPMVLNQDNIVGHPSPGVIVGVVGLAIGFGSNFLNAIHVENRLILNNGSHRAYALRQMGVTHAPCIIQHVSTREELGVAGPSELKRNPDLYLKNRRPSMLRDYFDPKLHAVIPCTRRLRQVRVGSAPTRPSAGLLGTASPPEAVAVESREV
jgi:hypothetical protein